MEEEQQNDSGSSVQSTTDFSIDHILHRAGGSNLNSNNHDLSQEHYSWLQCTRYCPPKVVRHQRRNRHQKRQLGRHPRIPFTSYQLSILEEKFQQSPYLSSQEVIILSKQLQLADIRVKIWFQNRRARQRREKTQSPKEVKCSSPKEGTHSNILGQMTTPYNLLSTTLFQNTTLDSRHVFNCLVPVSSSIQFNNTNL